MENNAQMFLNKNIPYNINLLFSQLYQYNCFEANLKRALLVNDFSKLPKVNLINAYWLYQWRKVSCYEAIKNDLSIYNSLENNYQANINNYYKIVEKLNIDMKLESNIDNSFIIGEYNPSMGIFDIDEETEFEIISKELWDCFVPPNSNNINQGTSIELQIQTLSKDSLIVHLNNCAFYAIFWNIEEEKIGKIVFKFDNILNKQAVINNIHQMGFNNFYAGSLDGLKGENEEKTLDYGNFTYKCVNKSQRKLNYEDFRKTKYPVGLRNVGMTCYMNAALQSLYNTPKLTNYIINYSNKIRERDYHKFSNYYLDIVLNLSRKAKGSKLKTDFSPKTFFNFIKQIGEFSPPAGDSIDLVRHFLETMNRELNGVNPNENCIFFNYLINANNMNMNNQLFQQIQNLNNFINTYGPQNKCIINNLFYFIEKSQIQCGNPNCQFTTANFNSQPYLILPLEEVRKKKVNIIVDNNMNMMNNNMNNMNMMNNNMNNMNNMNMMNNNMNNMNMMNNNMNNMNMMNNNINMMNMMNNNMMNNILRQNMFNKFNSEIKEVTLIECFDYYNNNKNQLNGMNQIHCKNCNFQVDATQWNTIYSLPEVLIINLSRGKGNMYKVNIIYQETIDLKDYVEIKDNITIYDLRCIVTHMGPSGTSGHYISFCFVENYNKWFKFDDSIVSESNFQEASHFGESYILFYKKRENIQPMNN